MSDQQERRQGIIENFRRARSATAAPEGGDLQVWVQPARGDLRYRHVLEQVRAMLMEIEGLGLVADVSDNVAEITGYSREEYIGKTPLFMTHDDDLAEIAKLTQNISGGPPVSAVFRLKHKDGHWIWLETGGVRSFLAPDGTMHAIAFSQDVTERMHAEAVLRESETRYRVVSETSRDLIVETDEEGALTFANPNVLETTGFSMQELFELDTFSLVHPDDLERVSGFFNRVMKEKSEVYYASYRLQCRDGSWIWVETRGISYIRADGQRRFLSVSRDVTEKLRAERERHDLEVRMQQAQKLESLGIMAGGIAHDFNNLLTPILGGAGLALMDLPEDSPVRIRLIRIQGAAQRAAALTNQMLAYAGAESLEIQAVDLSSLVEEIRPLLESASSGKTSIGYELKQNLPLIDADYSQLSQVLMNLLTNATEAVGDGAGLITVRTGISALDDATKFASWVGDLSPGPGVFFEVEDTGRGMDHATAARVFDPFFSTKFTGRGLGLAAALGIVKSHQGAIGIDTALGRGTRCRILLPLTQLADESEPISGPSTADSQGSDSLFSGS